MNTSIGLVGWIVAFVGFPLGGLAATTVIGRLDTPIEGFIGGLIAGAGVGLAQMLALRGSLNPGWRWVAATAVGLAVGVALGVVLLGDSTDLTETLARAPFAGLGVGLAQAWLIHPHRRGAWGWALGLTVLWPLAWWVTSLVITTSLETGFVVFGASGALVFQVLSGLLLRTLPPRHV
ncbi:MAG: hypothetical protein MUF38_17375 [Anaerolineae bacterium]|nr:hypothetical protein [Anaerolineae bacterium]